MCDIVLIIKDTLILYRSVSSAHLRGAGAAMVLGAQLCPISPFRSAILLFGESSLSWVFKATLDTVKRTKIVLEPAIVPPDKNRRYCAIH